MLREAFRSRSLAVAVRAASGGRRCEALPGVRIGFRKEECGIGSPRVVRAAVSWGMEGVDILRFVRAGMFWGGVNREGGIAVVNDSPWKGHYETLRWFGI